MRMLLLAAVAAFAFSPIGFAMADDVTNGLPSVEAPAGDGDAGSGAVADGGGEGDTSDAGSGASDGEE